MERGREGGMEEYMDRMMEEGHHSNNTLVYNYIVPINSDRTCPSYKSSTTSLTMIRRSSRTSFIHFKMAYGKRYKTLLLNISVYQQQSP